jgi:hypothetical protein
VTTAGPLGNLQGAQFVDVSLRGAPFVRADLSDVVMRAVDLAGADVDAPWLAEGGTFLVNGVDVVLLVEAELDRRFPGRAGRRNSGRCSAVGFSSPHAAVDELVAPGGS